MYGRTSGTDPVTVIAESDAESAEFLAWSAVHGLAVLMIDGPLRGITAAQAHDAGQDLIGMIERGL